MCWLECILGRVLVGFTILDSFAYECEKLLSHLLCRFAFVSRQRYDVICNLGRPRTRIEIRQDCFGLLDPPPDRQSAKPVVMVFKTTFMCQHQTYRWGSGSSTPSWLKILGISRFNWAGRAVLSSMCCYKNRTSLSKYSHCRKCFDRVLSHFNPYRRAQP